MNSNSIENYLALLTIRRKAGWRDMNIIGGIFIVSFLAMIALGMLDQLNGRSLYMVAAIVTVFGFSALMAWVKLRIIHGSIELIDNLRRANEGHDQS
ncbi:MAG: hypothetical protein CVU39_22515 [Chloroflexi bacterium HGW-Chloroflexi-10]|nr:MAG: hypothetical protein CVU39_22515 [Chloroflexi bacterium HGW-Chloroflexi-10]